jgi:hypothetical protein
MWFARADRVRAGILGMRGRYREFIFNFKNVVELALALHTIAGGRFFR